MTLSRKWRRHRGWMALGALVVVATVVLVIWRSAGAAEQPTTTYTTEAVATGTLSVTVSGSGNLELATESEVWPDTAGTVASVSVEQGEKVSKGDVLYTLDSAEAEAATEKALAVYQQAKSGVAQAEAQLAKAENDLDALQERAESPSSTVTSAEINAAEAEVSSAEASLASARTSRSQALDSYNDAKAAEEDLEATAPASGTVWSVSVEKGDSVSTEDGGSTSSGASDATAGSGSSASASSAPVTIAHDQPLVATLSINEVDSPTLEVGQRADLEFDALPDLALTGKVTDIAREGTVTSGVVTFDVTVTLDVKNEQLKPGMTVAATIVTDVARDALLVSNSAVKTDSTDGSYVLVLSPDGATTQQVSVTTGLSSDTQTQIISGLAEGQQIVTATSESSTESSDSNSGQGGGMMMGIPGAGGPGGGPGQ